jgi:uncharacterized membrane protein YqjE
MTQMAEFKVNLGEDAPTINAQGTFDISWKFLASLGIFLFLFLEVTLYLQMVIPNWVNQFLPVANELWFTLMVIFLAMVSIAFVWTLPRALRDLVAMWRASRKAESHPYQELIKDEEKEA